MADNDAKKTGFVHMTIPAAFVSTPYETKPNEQGKTYMKTIVTLPPNVKVNGIDIGGYKSSMFLSKFGMQNKLDGKPVVFSMSQDKPVDIWKGDGDDRTELHVDPWDLTKAVKAEREDYSARRSAEREAAKEAAKDDISKEDAEPSPDAPQEGIGALSAAAITSSEVLAEEMGSGRENPTLDI